MSATAPTSKITIYGWSTKQVGSNLRERAYVHLPVVKGTDEVQHDQVTEHRGMVRVRKRNSRVHRSERRGSLPLDRAPQFLCGRGVEGDEVLGPAARPRRLQLVPALRVAKVEREQSAAAAP
jgi:hypothetical protein